MKPEHDFDMETNGAVVTGTGLVALDVVLEDDRGLAGLWGGGTCGNVLTILSYLGWGAFPIGRLGNDRASHFIRQDLVRWGVSLEFLSVQPVSSAPIYIQRLRRTGQGMPVHSYSRICPMCHTWLPGYKPIVGAALPDVTGQIRQSQVFFFDRVSPAILALAKWSAEHGSLVVFEPAGLGNPVQFRQAFSIAHIVKYAHERRADFEVTWPQEGPLLEIETLGDQGLRFRSKVGSTTADNWSYVNPFDLNYVRDTAGSGDWCTAGIVHRLGRDGAAGFRKTSDDQLISAMKFGQALAAWNCGFVGARGGMYSRDRSTFKREIKQVLSGIPLSASSQSTTHAQIERNTSGICPACGEDWETAFGPSTSTRKAMRCDALASRE